MRTHVKKKNLRSRSYFFNIYKNHYYYYLLGEETNDTNDDRFFHPLIIIIINYDNYVGGEGGKCN